MKKRNGHVDSDPFSFEKRYGRSLDVAGLMDAVQTDLEEYRRTGRAPAYPHGTGSVHTSEERLAYYRSHGLNRCDDYPGGDVEFEADVLSGMERDEDITAVGPLKREDAYIIDRMHDGRFAYGADFEAFPIRPEVLLAYYENARRHGIFIVSCGYPGGVGRMRMDIMSGKYARDRLQERGF